MGGGLFIFSWSPVDSGVGWVDTSIVEMRFLFVDVRSLSSMLLEDLVFPCSSLGWEAGTG